MKRVENIKYANEHKRQVLDLYLPDKEEFETYIYIHGGGFDGGSKDEDGYVKMGEYIANQGYAAVVISYRLYPEAKYPEFIEDSAAAVAWTFKHINEYGKCNGIHVCGSSAGGYASMLLCFDKKWLGSHGIKPTDLAGFMHDAGQPSVHFNVLREMGLDEKRCIIDEKAPLYYIGMDEEYPPMQLVVSDNDIPCRLEQIQLVKATLKHFGHEDNVELKLIHGSHCQYVHDKDENGVPRAAILAVEYMDKYSSSNN